MNFFLAFSSSAVTLYTNLFGGNGGVSCTLHKEKTDGWMFVFLERV